jgi:hypothetical protein
MPYSSCANLQQLIQFLQQELAMPISQIQVGLKQSQREQGPLPTVLWRYGFITLEQLDRIQQWLVQRSTALE